MSSLRWIHLESNNINVQFNMPGHARAAVMSMEARAKKGDYSYRLMDPEDETELVRMRAMYLMPA